VWTQSNLDLLQQTDVLLSALESNMLVAWDEIALVDSGPPRSLLGIAVDLLSKCAREQHMHRWVSASKVIDNKYPQKNPQWGEELPSYVNQRQRPILHLYYCPFAHGRLSADCAWFNRQWCWVSRRSNVVGLLPPPCRSPVRIVHALTRLMQQSPANLIKDAQDGAMLIHDAIDCHMMLWGDTFEQFLQAIMKMAAAALGCGSFSHPTTGASVLETICKESSWIPFIKPNLVARWVKDHHVSWDFRALTSVFQQQPHHVLRMLELCYVANCNAFDPIYHPFLHPTLHTSTSIWKEATRDDHDSSSTVHEGLKSFVCMLDATWRQSTRPLMRMHLIHTAQLCNDLANVVCAMLDGKCA